MCRRVEHSTWLISIWLLVFKGSFLHFKYLQGFVLTFSKLHLVPDHISTESCVLCASTLYLSYPSNSYRATSIHGTSCRRLTQETGTISATKSYSSGAFSVRSTPWISSFVSHHGSELWLNSVLQMDLFF